MGMEQYMGYQALKGAKKEATSEDRELPVYNIAGTDFLVDIRKHEFRQKDNSFNRMSLGNVKEEFGFSFFYYDTHTKNRYTGATTDLPERVQVIIVPPIKALDPVGLARRHGLPDDYYSKKQVAKLETLPQFRKMERNANLSEDALSERERNEDRTHRIGKRP